MAEAAVKPSVTRDPERTRQKVLAAARAAFARQGLAGARVDAIAEAAGANKRMIYYYFTDKRGLFVATLEQIYGELCAVGEGLDLDAPPEEALDRYVESVWRYYRANPDTVTILNSENLHGGAHLADSPVIADLKHPFVEKLDGLLRRGERLGVFRPGQDAMRLHITVVALAYFFLGNNKTLSSFFGRDLSSAAEQEAWRDHMLASIRRLVLA